LGKVNFKRRFKRSLVLMKKSPSRIRVWAKHLMGNVAVIYAFFAGISDFSIKIGGQDTLPYNRIPDWISKNLLPITFIIITIYFCLYVLELLRKYKETQTARPRDYFPQLPIIDTTREFKNKRNLDNFAVGGAIEIVKHPYLDARISDNGWVADDIKINIYSNGKPFPEKTFGKPKAWEVDNSKFWLTRIDPVFADQPKLVLYLSPTKWSETEQAQSKVFQDTAFRHRLSSIEPEKHSIPNSFCLHIVVVFSDESILAMKRSKGTAYFPEHISLSFEEQFSDEDTSSGEDKMMTTWFQRSICEELFPLTGEAKKSVPWAFNRIKKFVSSMNVWSCIFEETTGTQSLFGVVQLKISPSEYIEEYNKIAIELGTRRDDEGSLFILKKQEVFNILSSGHGLLQPLFSDKEPEIARNFHPTSLYRASLVSACWKRDEIIGLKPNPDSLG